jgi:nucleoside-diphosphate-sugar epimerase
MPEAVGAPAVECTRSGSAEAVVAADMDYMLRALAGELPRLSGKRLLLTGGAGFLGYYLVQLAVRWNREGASRPLALTVLDSYARGIPAWVRQLGADPSVTFLRHDITRPLPETLGDFDYVIHAASIASPTYYRRRPLETMDANVNGLRALLERASRQNANGPPVAGVLFLSSSEIYGDPPPEQIPTSEDYRGNVSCTGPRACYDEAKRYGETLCVTFARQFGLPVTVARPFNNYGPGLKISDRRVLPDFARDVLAGRDLMLLSDGTPRRTFCYVADAVIGYYKVLLNGRPGEAYNIGVERPEISIRQLAELVVAQARELFGYRGKLVRGTAEDESYLVDNPGRRCPRIAKARVELGYQPGVSLADGLRRSLLWYAEHHDGLEA